MDDRVKLHLQLLSFAVTGESPLPFVLQRMLGAVDSRGLELPRELFAYGPSPLLDSLSEEFFDV